MSFGTGDKGVAYLRTGWSTSEPDFTWSIGHESVIELPPCPQDGIFIVQLILRPFIVPRLLPAQRLEIGVNGQAIGAREINTLAVVEFEIPTAIAVSGQPLHITLIVPGAACPRPLNDVDDDRILGMCLERIVFRRLCPAA